MPSCTRLKLLTRYDLSGYGKEDCELITLTRSEPNPNGPAWSAYCREAGDLRQRRDDDDVNGAEGVQLRRPTIACMSPYTKRVDLSANRNRCERGQ